jgi:hypothetical protein
MPDRDFGYVQGMAEDAFDFVLDYLGDHASATAAEIAAAKDSSGGAEAEAQVLLDLQTMASFGEVQVVGHDASGAARWGAAWPGRQRAALNP